MADLDGILQQCQEWAEDVNFPTVRSWLEKNPGGKVLGHFQVYFPEELAHAAGMLPMKICGAGGRIEAKAADSRFGSFICSIARTSLELGLSNRLDFLSAFVTHPICDVARSLAGIWGRNFPQFQSQILYLPQNANSRYAPTYLAEEYRRILTALEELTGKKVTADDLRRSIKVFNENRRLLRQLYAVKKETPWLISASEAYVLTYLAGLMPREEHNLLLAQVLELLPTRNKRKQDKVRVVFEGGFCEQPPLEMIQTIEDACYIVDDDFLVGLRWLTDDVPDYGDPVEALATSYIERSTYSCVQRDARKPKEDMLLKRIRNANAEACIVAAAKMCEPGLDEQVAYQHALEKENIPFLIMEFEEKMTAFEQMKMQVETFVESILFD